VDPTTVPTPRSRPPSMSPSSSLLLRATRAGLALLALAACASDEHGDAAAESASPAAATATAGPDGGRAAAFAFTAADLEAYERGIAREAELVREARARGAAATTPAERGAAAQAEWEDATIAGGAAASGLAPERYAQVRATVNRALQTLDFQGKIDGPQSLDTTNATPELKARLRSDPFAELAPESAAALRARLDSVVRAYVGYLSLTAVNG
jgi:hypothetical protein